MLRAAYRVAGDARAPTPPAMPLATLMRDDATLPLLTYVTPPYAILPRRR